MITYRIFNGNNIDNKDIHTFINTLKSNNKLDILGNYDDVTVAINRLCTYGDIGVLLYDKNKLVGLLIGKITYKWYDRDSPTFSEMFMYIDEQYRSYKQFNTLFEYVRTLCKRKGITRMVFGNGFKNNYKYGKLLQRKGFVETTSYTLGDRHE